MESRRNSERIKTKTYQKLIIAEKPAQKEFKKYQNIFKTISTNYHGTQPTDNEYPKSIKNKSKTYHVVASRKTAERGGI